MKALVVYDGNTEKVAQAICAGMKAGGLADVECKAAGSVSPADLKKADYWVLGGASSGFLAGRKIQGLVKKSVPTGGKQVAAAFDTRAAGAGAGMADKLSGLMKGGGVNVATTTYFSVNGGSLMAGEEALAKIYGLNLVNFFK